MKEVILYDFTKDWKDFFRGDKLPVFEHMKRQSIGDKHSICSKVEVPPFTFIQGAARQYFFSIRLVLMSMVYLQ